MSAREQVLDAFEQILITEGERAATLDAVAVRAEVSKGGLLYHFKSKEALVEGLVDRLVDLAAADATAMRAAPEGPSAYYVGTSVYQDSAFDRAIVATVRLAQDANPLAREAMRRIQETWYEVIVEEVGDPAISRAILLLGDGLYYNAALAGGSSPEQFASTVAGRDLAALLKVVEVLKQQARSTR